MKTENYAHVRRTIKKLDKQLSIAVHLQIELPPIKRSLSNICARGSVHGNQELSSLNAPNHESPDTSKTLLQCRLEHVQTNNQDIGRDNYFPVGNGYGQQLSSRIIPKPRIDLSSTDFGD